MMTSRTTSPVPGGVFHQREGVEFPDDISIVPTRGEGCYIWTESGDRYLDYLMGSGPEFLGHAHPEIVDALSEQAPKGTAFYKTERQGLELAERIVDAVPCADSLKFTSSGGEATYYALRLARASTGRSKTLKFQGGYHGFHDAVMRSSDKRPVEAVLEAGIPAGSVDTMGALPGVTDETVIAPFNDLDTTSEIVREYADDLAAIIVEPVQRSLPPVPGFLQGLRELCDDHDIVLIFDEVVTGFRMAMGGAQEYYGVEADLATYGKAIGGGTPMGAVCGRAEIMNLCDPKAVESDPAVYVSGTLSGNTLSMAAGHAVLDVLEAEEPFEDVIAHGDALMQSIDEILADSTIDGRSVGPGPIVDYAITDPDADLSNWEAIARSDAETKRAIDTELLRDGILHHVGGKKYVSTAHGEEEHERFEQAFAEAVETVETEQ